MRRQAFKRYGVVSAGGQLCFPVVGFAEALQEEASTDSLALLANILCWLSRLVDAGALPSSSTDPLDAP
eukprot:12911947-Prorocentrum_lima.AAC.1